MPNFIKENPVGIDLYIQNMQIALYENFVENWKLNQEDWNCYGRIYKQFDNEGLEYLPYPFLKPSNKIVPYGSDAPNTSFSPYIEYENPVLFQDTVKLQSFFDISETQKIGVDCQSTTKIVLYFFANIETLFINRIGSQDENLCNEVSCFVENIFGFIHHSKRIGIKTIMKEYSGYSKDNILFSNKQPLYAFSLEFEIYNYKINYNDFLLRQVLYQKTIQQLAFSMLGKVGDEEQFYEGYTYTSSDSSIASVSENGYVICLKVGSCDITTFPEGFIFHLIVEESNQTSGINSGNLILLSQPSGINYFIQTCQINLYNFILNVFNGNKNIQPNAPLNDLPFNYLGYVSPQQYNSFGRVYRNYKLVEGQKQYYPQYIKENTQEYIDVLFQDDVALQTFFDVGETMKEESNSLLTYTIIHVYFFVDLSKFYVPKILHNSLSPLPAISEYGIPERMDEEFIILISQWLMENSGFELFEIQRGIKKVMNEYNGYYIKCNSKANMQPFLCFRCDMKKYYDQSISYC